MKKDQGHIWQYLPLQYEIGLRVFLFALVCCLPYVGAVGQTNDQPSQAAAKSLLEAPVPGTLTGENRVFSPSRIFGKPALGSIGYDLKERPADKPAGLSLSTTIETKVENKTTNHVGSGGGGGAALEAASPPQGSSQPAPLYAYEFVDLVRQSLGTPLPVFGADLFSDGSRNPAVDPLTVPADYRVGPGDELLIRAWGQIDIDFQGQIDRSGNIFLPRIGNVMVAGMGLKDLTDHLRTTVQRQFKDFQLTVTLGGLRQIQYYVMGFAKQPGVYTAPSTSSALRGLLTAGGVLPFADLRHIELRRGGNVVAIIDAYRFLIDGDRSGDPQLLPGDVLFIRAGKAFAGIAGSVRRSAIFHLKEDTTVDELLKAAGGFGFAGRQPPIRVERLVNGRRQIEHIVYSESVGKRLVRDAELYVVLPVSPRIENAVTLRGHVAQPLRQEWMPGMRVSGLIGSGDNLVRLSNWAQRNERDTLAKVAALSRDNELKRDFPDVEWDYAAIERIDPSTLVSSVLTFNLARALAGEPSQDLVLQPGDVVVIFAQADFRQPQAKRLKMIRIEGEVGVPGVYPIASGESLQQAISRAGGLTDRAYLYGTMFTRLSAKLSEEERLRQVADRIEQDYLRYLAGRARNSLGQEDGSISTGEMDAVRSLIGRLRSVQAVGRIPLNVRYEQSSIEAFPDLALEDGDAILVPHRPATVTVVGSVFQEGSLLWMPNWDVDAYLDGAGGFRAHADRGAVVVVRADGTVRRSGGWFSRSGEIYPGDTIVVPEDVTLTSWTRAFRDWSQIFYQLGLGTAALKVLRSGL